MVYVAFLSLTDKLASQYTDYARNDYDALTDTILLPTR